MDSKKSLAIKLIIIFGIVSLFGDIIYEGTRGVIGPYLKILGANALIVGFISGFGEFIGYLFRLFSGYFSDRTGAYWLFTFIGYGMIAFIPALSFANIWQIAGLFIIMERIGKALRSPARDTIISHLTKRIGSGFAFGLHELLDQVGAIAGPLIFAFAFLNKETVLIDDYKMTFTFMWVPFILLILALIFLGIPFLVKMAIFLGNLKSTYQLPEKENLLSPSSPKLNPIPEATNSAKITLGGYSQPEMIIKIYQNGSFIREIATQPDGSFLVDNFSLAPGKNEIYAVAFNQKGASSKPSDKLFIVFDNTPPKITISEPEDNAHIYSFDGRVQIRGEVDEEATLTLNQKLVILDANNKFSQSLSLSEGKNELKFVAVDMAGNQTEKILTLYRE
ncbi:MAG: hypothetical protein QXF32_00355 [Candidatus Thermoplasmatota archaeon]